MTWCIVETWEESSFFIELFNGGVVFAIRFNVKLVQKLGE